MKVGRRTIDISHPDKVLFPSDGITKQDLAEYYKQAAEFMIGHMRARPISMQRFPDGIRKEGFYQKEVPEHFPEWVHRVSVKVKGGGTQEQVSVENAATLVYLADQGCITPHVWLSRQGKLDHPDRLIFDLDPTGKDFSLVRFAARQLKAILEEVGLVPFIMTTGSRGLHVVVPLDRSADFDTVRGFAKHVANALADRHAERLTTEVHKRKRKGRIFLDYLRNSYGQTSVAPYAIRALDGAPVATPLDWDELTNSRMGPQRYNIKNLFRRLGQRGDPWSNISRHARSLKPFPIFKDED